MGFNCGKEVLKICKSLHLYICEIRVAFVSGHGRTSGLMRPALVMPQAAALGEFCAAWNH